MNVADRKRLGIEVTEMFDYHGDQFQAGFRQWLRDNWRLYCVFHEKAQAMHRLRPHYSARTIIHVMRWHTEIQDAEVTFKINNNYTPDMARMYNKLTNSKFFEERAR